MSLIFCFMCSALSVFADLVPRGPAGLVWESHVTDGSLYYTEVESLVEAYEARVGQALGVGQRGKVALKINTRGGKGLSTPLQLIRAVIEVLEKRGYTRDSILLVDYSSHTLRLAGVMPPLSRAEAQFEGSPVIALDSGDFYDNEWFYDSPLPPALQQEPQLIGEARRSMQLEEGAQARKSFLPRPLIFDVDFWICLLYTSDAADD